MHCYTLPHNLEISARALLQASRLPTLLCDDRGAVLFANGLAEAFQKTQMPRLPMGTRNLTDILVGFAEVWLIDRAEENGCYLIEQELARGGLDLMAMLAREAEPTTGRVTLLADNAWIIEMSLHPAAVRLGWSGRLDLHTGDAIWIVQLYKLPRAHVEAIQRGSVFCGLAHDLRSPLVAIQSILQESDFAEPGVSVSRNISMGERSKLVAQSLRRRSELANLADRALRLVDGLLNIFSAEIRTLRPAPLCPRLLMEDAIEAVGALARRADVEIALLDGECPPLVEGDYDLLGRCLFNILDNAIRHAAPSQRVECLVNHRATDEGEWVEWSIRDWGPGLEPNLRREVFTAFVQGRCSDRSPRPSSDASEFPQRMSGVGLGLALVASVATRHGGKVTCEMPAGGGAQFRLALPLTSICGKDDVRESKGETGAR